MCGFVLFFFLHFACLGMLLVCDESKNNVSVRVCVNSIYVFASFFCASVWVDDFISARSHHWARSCDSSVRRVQVWELLLILPMQLLWKFIKVLRPLCHLCECGRESAVQGEAAGENGKMKILTRAKACGQAPGHKMKSHWYASSELLFIYSKTLSKGWIQI